MIRKLLIANRGEIAARVITTARRLGIATVAVHSDADAQALHVALADEAVRIGPAPVAESYLDTKAILQAAQATGADAIHPGYGFLSENPDFVEAVEAAGLIFVGPPASAIRAMGLKDAAKTLMETAGVPVVPGYHGAAQDTETLAKAANDTGYPVLIKARAGGGGKGMRLVERPEDFAEALAGAQREGKASFGDAGVLIEKYITTPRHIEIQVFADSHGNIVHMFERDCSLQRRHQKVIEEAPAPGMPEDVRSAMGSAAVEAARAIGYVGAGTVEFIADGSGPLRTDGFWFMEMNTRLQVEHPVTEAITGLDLVALQLDVAAGKPLPFKQDDLAIDGHAFEARIYAEDAGNGFLPATGRLEKVRFPEGVFFERGPVRIDAGVTEGDEITPHYDPMIAKLIVHGPNRSTALTQLAQALDACRIAGVVTNTGFLTRLARHAGFAAGELDTGLIGRDLAALTETAACDLLLPKAVAALAALNLPRRALSGDPWQDLTGWQAWGETRNKIMLTHDDKVCETSVILRGPQAFEVDGLVLEATWRGDELAIRSEDVERGFGIHCSRSRVTVFAAGNTHIFGVPDPLSRSGSDGTTGDLVTAPMPGMVRHVSAARGATVGKGTALLVLEAMKMEHTLRAPREGVVAEVYVTPGQQVSDGTNLVRFEAEEDE